MTILDKFYWLLVKCGNSAQVLLLLFFRLNWGWKFFLTGKGKLLHHSDIASFFASLNLPAPDLTAWFVGGIECVGGLLLLLGLATRLTGLVLTLNMVVAFLSVEDDRSKVFNFFNDQDAFLQADPFFFLLAALLSFCFGGGPLSIDALLGRKLQAVAKLSTSS